MIETTGLLSGTPPGTGDLLSLVLDSMNLSGMVLFRAEFSEPWCVVTPNSMQLAKVLPFHTEHIIPFHVIAAGGCWLEAASGEPVWLSEGDAVLLPHGPSHKLKGREATRPVQVGHLLPRPPWADMPVVTHGGPGEQTTIICGFLQCDALLFRPILRNLPVLLHVSPRGTGDEAWLVSTIRHTAEEASRTMPGSRSMLPRLTELMFIEVLRKHLGELSLDEVGWFAAYKDPVAGAALRHMHGAPGHRWNVESLARRIGVSKTTLTERFRQLLDQPPMHYLSGWRLQLAAQQLRSGKMPIKAIAEASGYETVAAFSRAFKRHFGSPPGDWRRRQIRGPG